MVPHFTFAGYSGSGKTTLAIQVIKILSNKGYKIASFKHDGHKFQMDKEGKDTYRLKEAGAKTVAISSMEKYAIISDSDHRLSFGELAKFVTDDIDIIIGEGFKEDVIPKIVVHRKDNLKPRACLDDRNVIAAVTDCPEDFPHIEHIFDINDINGVTDFIEAKFLKKD